MESAIRIHQVIERDGEIAVSGLPYRKGQHIEMIVHTEKPGNHRAASRTARDLRRSRIVGIWKARRDIGSSLEFSRRLRRQAQTRAIRT
jgi:hypothetical protein